MRLRQVVHPAAVVMVARLALVVAALHVLVVAELHALVAVARLVVPRLPTRPN
jgi:hypothetical protein